MRPGKTFREILEAAAVAKSRRVAERARLANRIAKCANGIASKRRAYGIKRRALEHAVACFPNRYALGGLELDGQLARIQYGDHASFHMPVSSCGVATRSWIENERARIVAAWAVLRRAA